MVVGFKIIFQIIFKVSKQKTYYYTIIVKV